MADTVIHNAKAYLERGRFAGAVLVRGDKIAAVGANAEIQALAPGAEKIDAGGREDRCRGRAPRAGLQRFPFAPAQLWQQSSPYSGL